MMTMQPELRVSPRKVVRAGEPCRVKLSGKGQFRNGFKFRGYNPETGYAEVVAPNGNIRSVRPEGIAAPVAHRPKS